MASRFSPGALLLARAGTSAADVARHVGKTPAAVSNWLTGLRRPPSQLFEAVSDLAGEDAAERLQDLLERRRRELSRA